MDGEGGEDVTGGMGGGTTPSGSGSGGGAGGGVEGGGSGVGGVGGSVITVSGALSGGPKEERESSSTSFSSPFSSNSKVIHSGYLHKIGKMFKRGRR